MPKPHVLHIAESTDVEASIEIQRSRFITVLRRVGSETAARKLILDCQHRWPQARHHCSAFRYGSEDTGLVERSNDDGEPSGTAGRPMLDTLRSTGIIDVCAVVTRYFGGIKLGTGGLVRAYTQAIHSALDQAELFVPEKRTIVQIELSYEEAGKVEALLRNKNIDILGIQYATMVSVTCSLQEGATDYVTQLVSATLGRETTVNILETTLVDIALRT